MPKGIQGFQKGQKCKNWNGFQKGHLSFLSIEDYKKIGKKVSKKLKGRKLSEEHKRKLSETQKGKKLSEETKKKISEGNKGKKMTEEAKRKISEARKGENNPNWGKLASKETRRKQSKAHIGKKYKSMSQEGRRNISEGQKGKKHTEETKKKMSEARKGEKSWNWQGGKSFEPYGLEFNKNLKEQIRKKYGYRCQQCFRHQDELYSKSGKKYKLMIHHLDYNKQNNQENNLISLCRNCHAQTNFNREDWINYFKNKL